MQILGDGSTELPVFNTHRRASVSPHSSALTPAPWQRFTVLRSKLQVQSPLRVLCGMSWLGFTQWGFTQWVGWVQAYPESLLAKLADNEDDGVMAEGANVIRLDRDPTLFSHVLQLFVDKPVAQPTLYEELDFYGLPPSSIMLPASMAADICSRPGESVVSSIIDQMAVLMHETLSNDEGIKRSFHSSQWAKALDVPQLTFYLTKPPNDPRHPEYSISQWSEVQVFLKHHLERNTKIVSLPSFIQQPLETRLRSLGYAVGTLPNVHYPNVQEITVSWGDN
jgi:hypothetical protein